MRFLSRNKVYEKKEAQKDAKKIYIFCEGEDREVNYFRYFQGFSSNIDIIPIQNLQGQSDPSKLRDHAILLFEGGESHPVKYKLSAEYKDEVWFVIDTDRWNENNKIQSLLDFCNSRNQITPGWFVAQSNPCFELWLYYHFNNSKPEKTEVNSFVTFKDYVNHKIKGGFDNRKMPLKIKSAITNSINNFESEFGQPMLYSTEVHILAGIIYPFVSNQIEKILAVLNSFHTDLSKPQPDI